MSGFPRFDFAHADGAGFVGGLFGVRVKDRVGQPVGGFVVHGDEDLPGLHAWRSERHGVQLTAAGLDADPFVGCDAE